MKKYGYEIREVDAWADPESGWNWNTSYRVGDIKTAGDVNRAMMTFLRKKHGIVCKKGACRIEYDGDVYTLQSRKTGEPFYAAIPKF